MSPPNEPCRSALPSELLRRLNAALARRGPLLADPQTNVARVFNAAGDGIDGLVIEKLADVLVAQLYAGRLALPEEVVQALCAEAAQRLGARAVYRKWFPKDRATAARELAASHHGAAPWIGVAVPPELPVREHGLTFLVHPYDGYATGLFLDHRAQRRCIRELAAGRRVLNTFAYTCAFAVAAAAGGAATTVNVDVSRKYLEWGKRNLVVNGMTLDRHRFICADVFDYFRRAARQGHRFDLIILDPPTFAHVPKSRRVFELAGRLEHLVGEAVNLLESRGYVHLSVNRTGTTRRQLRDVLARAARVRARVCEVLESPPLAEDFPGVTPGATAILGRVS